MENSLITQKPLYLIPLLIFYESLSNASLSLSDPPPPLHYLPLHHKRKQKKNFVRDSTHAISSNVTIKLGMLHYYFIFLAVPCATSAHSAVSLCIIEIAISAGKSGDVYILHQFSGSGEKKVFPVTSRIWFSWTVPRLLTLHNNFIFLEEE